MATVQFPPAVLAAADPNVTSSGEPPTLPACWVRRDRLEMRLTEATRRKVTILTGVPGSGKTSLVAGWVKSSWPGPVRWLTASSLGTSASLTEDLAGRVRPLRRRATSIGATDHPAGSARRIPRFEESPASLVVVDDTHLIEDSRVAAEVERVAMESGPGTKLILIGRHPGALSLARLGLATEVVEIEGKELEFNLEESAALLSLTTGQPVDVEAVRPLVERTRGWVVALRLSAIQLGQRFSPRGVADDLDTPGGALWQYLETEVLGQLPEATVDFLIQMSVVAEPTAELSEAVTGRSDARRLLDELVMEHEFLEPATTKGSFVCHPVLREHLLQRFARQGQRAMAEAHLKAGGWFARTDDLESAMHHYVRANAEDLALALGAEQAIGHLLTGALAGHDTLLPGEIPLCYFAANPVRMYALCAALLSASRLAEAAEWLGRLEISLGDSVETTWNRARAQLLWAIHDSESCDSEGVIAHFDTARQLLEEIGACTEGQVGPTWLQPLDNAVMAVMPWLVAKAQAEVGRPEDARRALEHHRHPDQQPGGALALGPLAAVALASGRLGEALGLARRAVETVEHGSQSAILRVESHLVLAGVLFEQDSVAEARDELGKARRIAQEAELRQWQFVIDCDAARISLSEGNPASALRQLQTIREDSLTQTVPSVLAVKMSQLELRCRLAMGDSDHARSILAQIPESARRPDSLIRIHLCAGRPDRAALELGRAASPAGVRDRIEMLLLRARVNLQLGNPRVAEHALDEALELGRREHFVRVFLEEPSQVLDALGAPGTNRGDSYISDLLARRSGETSRRGSANAAMIEPLTERERELVAFLPSHLSQYEIAKEMYISANTVKTHIKGLYRKLGANSRSEAVQLARSCGLL